MSLVPQSIYLVNGFVYSVLIPIYLTNGCIMPRKLFSIIHTEIVFKYNGALRRDRGLVL